MGIALGVAGLEYLSKASKVIQSNRCRIELPRVKRLY